MIRLSFVSAALLGALLLGGCASTPTALSNAPAESPTVAAVHESPERYAGDRVRWGGTIAGVINKPSRTELIIVARPVRDNGRPYADARSPGRFLARVSRFLDPAVYGEGRSVTVVGTIVGGTVRRIGDYPYHYPVVRAESLYLWEPLPPPRPTPCFAGPFWHGSFWNPWYGPIPWHDHYCY